MKILALETSSLDGSVALLENDVVVQQCELFAEQRTAQSFAPAIQNLLRAVQWQPRAIELIAVTQGPGSFTGLRVGVTAAKTLAYATGAEVIGVDTLQAVAVQAFEALAFDAHAVTNFDIESISSVINAQRGELFVARFAATSQIPPAEVDAPRIVSKERWLSSLDNGTLVAGPGLIRFEDQLPKNVPVSDRTNWQPRAATVGRIGYYRYQNGARDDLWKIAPKYFRKSAAEEKWESSRQ